jgi:hypothetical protein
VVAFLYKLAGSSLEVCMIEKEGYKRGEVLKVFIRQVFDFELVDVF